MLNDFKPVLKILLRFLILYLILLGGYQLYLNYYSGQGLDPISREVASQVTSIQNMIGYESVMQEVKERETSYFILLGQVTTRMVEGCNVISIMIMFLAFVFAFYRGKKTFVFALVGIIILHLMNIFRIAGLNILALEKPEYLKIGHDYIFPAIIYGTVVLLWLIWIKFFSIKPDETN